jgi:hypothetical protein
MEWIEKDKRYNDPGQKYVAGTSTQSGRWHGCRTQDIVASSWKESPEQKPFGTSVTLVVYSHGFNSVSSDPLQVCNQ